MMICMILSLVIGLISVTCCDLELQSINPNVVQVEQPDDPFVRLH